MGRAALQSGRNVPTWSKTCCLCHQSVTVFVCHVLCPCDLFSYLGKELRVEYAQSNTTILTSIINLLTPNVDYSGRTAPVTSKCFSLYIYSTNIGTENFKHGI